MPKRELEREEQVVVRKRKKEFEEKLEREVEVKSRERVWRSQQWEMLGN